MAKIMVRQWSFCPKCRGGGCRECQGKGTVVALIPLKSLPAGVKSFGLRGSYAKAQKDFIKEQERQLESKKHGQDPEYRAKVSAASKKYWQIRLKAGATGERRGVNM